MENQNLTVRYANQTKILKLDPLLIYVRVETLGPHPVLVNCLIAQHALTFFYQLQPNAKLALYGHYNNRHQFVITKFMVGRPVQILAS